MKNLKISYIKKLGNSQYFKLAIEGFLYLLENKLTESNQLIQDNFKCICAEYNNKPIGCIVFDTYDDNCIWMYLIYVQQKFQNEKVFSQMLKRLEEWCRN